jgi:hypothetical protein
LESTLAFSTQKLSFVIRKWHILKTI